ncbi:hypothetical protein AB595_12590 [Massilia sp. WF1]|uniref:lysozyme inhibitor LprI family protein n=1 Tax=unclassified Massilia TaxID=2609279 RepID=UPI00064B0FA3|nr:MULTISPECIES: lysozyme inhibitor LprI family protein [unclassified Massilia]ALK97418.1 hypothetical protein AM586_15470 [Massilia sp. WG5]KLU36599.1 hypothetical protein AB595_12590 [Massilia sp. WF1]
MHALVRKIPACLLAAGAALAVCQPAPAAGPYPNTSNFGVPFSQDEDWYRQCMRVERLQPPPSAMKAPAGCKARELYYRKRGQAQTSPAEWELVRACALENHDDAVLMMMYANGDGVAQDSDRAIHHACTLDFVAKAEMEGRIAHLAKGPQPGKRFDLCDDVTSGSMGAVCADLHETQDRRVREARLDRAVRALPAASREAFAILCRAAARYAEAGAEEVDAHGTAAAGFAIQRQARLREEFMQAALDAIGGKLPSASAADATARDGELNQVYREVMAIPSTQPDWPDRIGDSTIGHADVRKTERLWLAYRDAFAAFAASLPSGDERTAVTTLLTVQRVDLLQKIARWR